MPYDVRGSGIDGAMELEEEGKDDDYFEDSAALGKKIIQLQCINMFLMSATWTYVE